jgi:DNA modification methylase
MSTPSRRAPSRTFDLDAIRVPYKTTREEIERRKLDENGRRNTDAGFGRDRTKTYAKGGADPGNVVSAPQSYNQHYGPAGDHTAVMPEGLAAFFIKACCPSGGVVIDPFAGSATTTVVARRLARLAGGVELHEEHVAASRHRIAADVADDVAGVLQIAM